jgi:hypothetical protein
MVLEQTSDPTLCSQYQRCENDYRFDTIYKNVPVQCLLPYQASLLIRAFTNFLVFIFIFFLALVAPAFSL